MVIMNIYWVEMVSFIYIFDMDLLFDKVCIYLNNKIIYLNNLGV